MVVGAHGGQWAPGIGDPTVIGWVTVFAYFAGALACFQAGKSRRRISGSESSQESRFWFILGAVLLALGVNKQLDLQTFFTVWGRALARSQGWYAQRRAAQVNFIIGIGLSGAAAGGYFAWLVRNHLNKVWLALAGSMSLICFVLIRAASFHHIDRFLGVRFGGAKINGLLELGGIACVLYSALSRKNSKRREAAASSAPF